MKDLSWDAEVPICKMRIMISKWILDRVKQRNPTLAEYVDNYGSLNEQSITAKSSEMAESTLPVRWAEYIAEVCPEGTNSCDNKDKCVKELHDENLDDETFLLSFNEHCSA